MNLLKIAGLILPLAIATGCGNNIKQATETQDSTKTTQAPVIDSNFVYQVEQFSDLRILRYNVPGFNELTLKQKEMVYYLYEAALCGRDIYFDQNYKYNLTIRKTIETIIGTFKSDKNTDDYKKFLVYAKRFWFSNGMHHHYSNDKIIPEISKEYFAELIKGSNTAKLPLKGTEKPAEFIERITPILFDSTVASKKVNLDPKNDLLTSSAVNFYEGVTQKEVIAFYEKMTDKDSKTPLMLGLNSKLVKQNGAIIEKKWMVGGMYTAAIEKIVYWLKKASALAENPEQKDALDKLIHYYTTGDLKDFDDYNIAWVKDVQSVIDVVNGFIEVYDDPLGKKGSFEAVVSIKDMEASKRIKAIGDQAQWFEDHSPIMDGHKKKDVQGITAKVINVVVECGDAAPSSAIGINLPNNEWIRATHGSKSVNLGNIVESLDHSAGSGIVDEFYFDDLTKERVKKYAPFADILHTDMHEVIGHASGQINKGIGQPHETLKNYSSTLEEARADLVALYYLMDQKLIDIGVMPSLEYGKAAYDEYIGRGLMIQLSRIKLGYEIEEAHMRNRQLICKWAMEKGSKEKVVEKKQKDGKTFFVINDYNKLRSLFGDLLREIQRIKSEGDYKAGHDLVENYGVKIDKALHSEVLERYNKLNIPPYAGFIQPKLIPVVDGARIVDVKIEYPMDFVEQMMEYGKKYSLLPVEN
ncbi:MAG: dihydrofolate reductase [Bacteroidetes bacterium]|nr:dihydrofolate reductase [Bacteroidota bacterium]